MRISRQRRRLLVAVVVAAAVAGLAAGVVLARDDSGRALAQGPPQVLAQGKFRSLTWGTVGTASIVRDPSGNLKLRLSSSFMTKEAPETYVYLAKYHGQQRTFWKEVGLLRSSQGGQEYDLPADAATIPGVSVAIYCAKCNKISGLAQLEPARTAS
jgi:electron transfer DM13